MKNFLKRLLPVVDPLLVPLVAPSAMLLRIIRRAGIQRMPFCKRTLLGTGVFPILDQYCEPQFNFRDQVSGFDAPRSLPGIDWNIPEQLELLGRLCFSDELAELSAGGAEARDDPQQFRINNGSFESGDAEVWYNVIRLHKPSRIVEIGSGNSTLLAAMAIRRNQAEDPNYACRHVCIEPYEAPWLEETGVSVLRSRVEELDPSWFDDLGPGDILFIDSSHVIRPEGDILFEYLEILPRLARGVIVHVHDIFSPRNYPQSWLVDEVRLWNEQYLLEAFLSYNRSWKTIAALNLLHHDHHEALKRVCPFLTPDREPGSFYMCRA